jgi:transcriptional regulator GlxA family with amidase domain
VAVEAVDESGRRWCRDQQYGPHDGPVADRAACHAEEAAQLLAQIADRFLRLIGVPPMHYLASWRMQVATQKLRNTSASLAQVAEMVGYGSEAAFSHAFKKAFGTAPATWRRSNS